MSLPRNSLDDYIRRRWLMDYSLLVESYPYLPPDVVALPLQHHRFRFELRFPNEDLFRTFQARLLKDGIFFEASVRRKDSYLARLIEPVENESLTVTNFKRFFKVGAAVWGLSLTPLERGWSLIRFVLFRYF